MSLTDARARLADVVDTARVEHHPVFITRRGRRVAAVVAAEDLERLIAAAEDLADSAPRARPATSWPAASPQFRGSRSRPTSA